MSNRWWNPFDGMEQVAFKPVAGGYVYRAPNPWLIGPGRYYLVNETQKAALIAHHRWTMSFTFWGIVIGCGLGIPCANLASSGNSWVTLAIALLVGLAIGFVINLQLYIKVKPIIASMTPASATITQRDAFNRQATFLSSGRMLGFAALDLALLALTVWGAMSGPNGWDVMAVVGTALFGGGAIYFLALYVAKLRRSAA